MLVLGIDPAPVKNSIVFDGIKFREFSPYNLKRFIDKISYIKDDIFIAWDAPLSGAISKKNFNLYERDIERYFNRNNKRIRDFSIPKGISTLGFASCSHWTLSQYIFGYPNLNPSISSNHKFKLIHQLKDIDYHNTLQITEAHPALAMWIILEKTLSKHPLFQDTWQYKGTNAKDKKNLERREVIIDSLINSKFINSLINLEPYKNELLKSDDKLDTFLCWIMAKKLLLKKDDVKIYGDNKKGSFLLPTFEYIQIT